MPPIKTSIYDVFLPKAPRAHLFINLISLKSISVFFVASFNRFKILIFCIDNSVASAPLFTAMTRLPSLSKYAGWLCFAISKFVTKGHNSFSAVIFKLFSRPRFSFTVGMRSPIFVWVPFLIF